MSLVIIEVDGVHRNTPEEIEPLKLAIQGVSASFRVAVVYPEEHRYGGGTIWPELLHVWLPEAGKVLITVVGTKITEWAVKRVRGRRDRQVTAFLYGPDGRVVKEIRVDEKLAITEKEREESTPTRKRPKVDD